MRVGIDLGTTHSRIARVDAMGTAVLLSDAADPSCFATPSLVHLGPEGAFVGRSAEDLLLDNPRLPVARSPHRALGGPESPGAVAPWIDAKGRAWSPESLTALILRKLIRDLQAVTDEPISQAVLAVPLGYGREARGRVIASGMLAGLDQVDLVEEPLAVAVHYGLDEGPAGQATLVYDLGARHFEATVLRTRPGAIDALAVARVPGAGAEDIDDAIADLIAEATREAHRVDVRCEPGAIPVLRRHAASLRDRLVAPSRKDVRMSLLLAGRVLPMVLTRGVIDRVAASLVDRTLDACGGAIASAGLDWSKIDQVFLAGSVATLPPIESALRQAAGRAGLIISRRHPLTAVTFGAALVAARLGASAAPAPEAADPHGPVAATFGLTGAEIGLRHVDPDSGATGVLIVIPRNAAAPTSRKVMVYTRRPDQGRLILDVVRSEKPTAAPISVGRIDLLIGDAGRDHAVEVTLECDRSGTGRVVVRDPSSGRVVRRVLGRAEPEAEPHEDQRRLVEETAVVE